MKATTAIAATALALLATAGAGGVASAAPSAGPAGSCYSQADTPYLFSTAIVRTSGQTTCGTQYALVIDYRSDVNQAWSNVTTSYSPTGTGSLYAYSTPARTGYYRASISPVGNAVTYSPDVYLVA